MTVKTSRDVRTPADLAGWDPASKLGFPGELPSTRGIQPTMYRGRLWTMRQYAGFGTAAESNKRYRFLLKQGQTGLSVAFDLPTQIGYDSDDPDVTEEVGRVGVALDTLADAEILFDGIPLDQVSTSWTINGTAAIMLAFYVAVGKKQGVPVDKLRGTIQNDILKEYVARGTWIWPPEPSIRLIVDTIEFCAAHVPRYNAISVAGAHFRDAGCTAAQEMAFTLSDAVTYVDAVLERGRMGIDEFAPQVSFFFYTHNDFFEEIAKYRAARRLWARIAKERFGARDERSMKLRFHAQTAGCALTWQQPENNLVRTAIQAMAAVMGGTQSLHTNSLDEAYALPSERAATLALRTQQVIAHESGVADTIDPLAGSYYVESLTQRMEEGFERYLGEIEKMGGMVEAVERGYPQREITEASFHFQQQVEEGEKVVVGINKYATAEQAPILTLAIDPDVEKKQIARLTGTRKTRDRGRWTESMDALRHAAKAGDELMPRFLECARANASVGEQVLVLKEVFGEYHDPGYF